MSELNKFPSSFTSSQFKLSITREEIDTITSSLAHTLNQKYKGEELILIGALKGSITFIADLAKKLKDIKVYIDFVKLESVGRSKENSGSIIIKKDISTNILDKNILIVEEVIDTGRALEFLYNRLKQSGPRSIEIITLFDKPYKRAINLKANYIGKQLEDQFIVGYGLDLEDYGRNLQDLYCLEFPN